MFSVLARVHRLRTSYSGGDLPIHLFSSLLELREKLIFIKIDISALADNREWRLPEWQGVKENLWRLQDQLSYNIKIVAWAIDTVDDTSTEDRPALKLFINRLKFMKSGKLLIRRPAQSANPFFFGKLYSSALQLG